MAVAPDPTICVFAPDLLVTVTIERSTTGADDVHFHAGGQGFWIARMAVKLGEATALCAPVGGETGQVARALVNGADLQFVGVTVGTDNPAYVHDRRCGERREVAHTAPGPIARHDLDELYGAALGAALTADVFVLTGGISAARIPTSFFRRLGADLAAAGVTVTGDLHGTQLDAFLAGGPISLLKVSDEDLVQDGRLIDGCSDDDARAAVRELQRCGCEDVILSRSGAADLAHMGASWYEVRSPRLEPTDHRGSGDSMTAALAVGRARDLDVERTLRLARAAGAANVTRHGLGSSNVRLVAPLTSMVEVERLGND